MRIVGGQLGGRRLSAPRAGDTRPTTDRVREGIASALEARGALTGAIVLDLFAGSGALGLEALSRGAARLCAVDADPRAVACVTANVRALDVGDRARVMRADLFARAFPGKLRSVDPGPYSLVFADAPYAEIDRVPALLDALLDAGLLTPGALVAVEHASKVTPGWGAGFTAVARYRYGDSTMSLVEAGAAGGSTPPELG